MSRLKKNLWTLAGLAFLVSISRPGGALRADLDKEAKERKDEKGVKPELGGDEHERYHKQLAEEGEKTLEEINKLLEEIQKGLGGKQTGEATQARQKEVVERLDKLIKELSKG